MEAAQEPIIWVTGFREKKFRFEFENHSGFSNISRDTL